MDALTNYRGIIACVPEKYHDSYAQGQPKEIDTVILRDDERGEYRLFRFGWESKKRVHDPVFYLRIKNDKIYIEENWTRAFRITTSCWRSIRRLFAI